MDATNQFKSEVKRSSSPQIKKRLEMDKVRRSSSVELVSALNEQRAFENREKAIQHIKEKAAEDLTKVNLGHERVIQEKLEWQKHMEDELVDHMDRAAHNRERILREKQEKAHQDVQHAKEIAESKKKDTGKSLNYQHPILHTDQQMVKTEPFDEETQPLLRQIPSSN